jgi:hypothetical protein
MLVTALRAAETLAAFHVQHAENSVGATCEYHLDMARRCTVDAGSITHAILAAGVTMENQAEAMRRRDMETAQKILDRHVIMHGVGLPAEDVPAARTAMARDIAEALAAERGVSAP